jgi:hypothetical protein
VFQDLLYLPSQSPFSLRGDEGGGSKNVVAENERSRAEDDAGSENSQFKIRTAL